MAESEEGLRKRLEWKFGTPTKGLRGSQPPNPGGSE